MAPKSTSNASSTARAARRTPAPPRLSRTRKPEAMSAEDWQAELRRQFGREQSFKLERLSDEPVFSEFAVANPQTGGRYRVAIRGAGVGENFCSCADFATNDLGTCKHIEFTLARLEARRGGKAALKRGFHPPYSEVYLHYAGARRLRFRAGTDCPAALAQQGRRMFDGHAGGAVDIEAFLRAASKAGHDVRCYDDARAFVARMRDDAARRNILAEAYPKGAKSAKLLKLLKTRLYPYQAEGALFAATAGRALIADDMGLGKTIQAIAAAELLSRHCGAERVLVVCPTSLKHQWQREIARFSGRGAQVIHGLHAARRQQYANVADANAWAKITNYETLARDLDLINAWSPDVVIVDEAQRIKNWNTVAARSLKRIVSAYAIVLSGTPLQNRLEELISIVQFVDQHRLGPTWRLLENHQQRDEAGRVVGYRELDRIGATLAPIMIRRRKAEVLDQLPERIDNTLFVPMTEQQLVHHTENGDTVARIVKRWRKNGFLSDVDQRVLTCALQNMRMSCNSTYLLDHETDHGTKADELMTVLEEVFEQPGAKAVIFSQWVRTHELIVRRLQSRGWGHVLFHGGVPSDQRPALIDRFHDDPACRVFLSTDAGGVGLNLQHAAAAIVNMDLPWNPAVLEQRIGRVHRLGQRKSVQVVNFVAQGSIEEGMLSVLAFKKSLFAGVLDGGESEIFMQGTRLSKFMESVDQVTGAMGSAEPAEAPQADAPQQPEPTAPAPAADPWAPLIDAGLELVQTLARGNGHAGERPAWIERDPHTGRDILKLPVPEPDTVKRLAEALGGLLAGLRR
ncbi:DEAD/DEAH box helicase [Piscinibacter sp.]|uniref:DEAD/DEAH box helicase n=1 Tax=Piscinibacter sp. TaxID=1903157 RepID=UPI002CE1265C|nr:DEAD/DEAH box helicase [Albitalea sp.]HUG23968.1 DEAD/DEAH box helicase [Albitalea sp.]